MNSLFYLKPNVAPKPCFNYWPLWPSLIPPPWASRIVSKVHIRAMETYIAHPEFHAEAARNPALMGGPWIDYPEPRVEEIQALLAATKTDQAVLLELSDAIETLDDLLRDEAKGLSLERVYARVPNILRGLVELVYDTNHNPSVRFLEGMMYRSPLYQRHLQKVALTMVTGDWLPYERSTPLLANDPKHVFLDVAFDDRRLDKLFEAEFRPQRIEALAEELGVSPSRSELFASLFSSEPAPQRHTPPPDGVVRVRYMGHASVLIETKDVSVLTDPFLSYEYPNTVSRYTIQDLPRHIDYVLLTHAHNDHLRPETLLRLRSRIGTVVVPRAAGRRLHDPSLKLVLTNLGFSRVVEPQELESIEIPGGAITSIPFLGEHSDLDIQGKCGYHVGLGKASIICAADSANLDDMLYARLREYLGHVDILFMGMECEGSPLSWYYGMLLTQGIDEEINQSRRDKCSNCAQAIAVVDKLEPKYAYIYAMGQEPWLNHVLAINQSGTHPSIKESDQFVAHCRARGLESERLYGFKEIILD
jgi:L-ascorbate metabolism protein UlaG (beta-lactamase superfamily)